MSQAHEYELSKEESAKRASADEAHKAEVAQAAAEAKVRHIAQLATFTFETR